MDFTTGPGDMCSAPVKLKAIQKLIGAKADGAKIEDKHF